MDNKKEPMNTTILPFFNYPKKIRTTLAAYILIFFPAAIVVSPPLTALLEACLYLIFIITPELRKRFVESLSQPMVICGLALCLFIIISSLWSDAPLDEKLEHMKNWRKVLLLPIAVSLAQEAQFKQRFVWFFVIAMTFYAVLSWLDHLSIIALYNLANSILRNHTTQAMVFFIAVFSAISLFFFRETTLKQKAILAVFIVILLTNLFIISTSRSGYLLGLILIICLSIFIFRKKSILITPIVLLLFGSVLYFSPTPKKQIIDIWNDVVNMEQKEFLTSGGARIVFVQNTLPIIAESPLFGHGLKSMKTMYAKQVQGKNGWQATITRDPHNQYLLIMVEQGAIGLLIFLGFIFSCFRQRPETFYQYLGISVLLGWMATSMFNGHFSASVEGKIIFVWCGVMLAMNNTIKKVITT